MSYRSTPSEYEVDNNNEEENSNGENGNNSYVGPNRSNMGNTKPIGKGTYGLILQPALPNLKANGTTEKFPDMVTKAYFSKNSMNQTIASTKKIYELTGNEGHAVSEYAYKYRAKNIPNSIKQTLLSDEYKVNMNKIYGSNPIPMIRMKNLGIDMRHDNLKTAIGKLSEIPAATLLEQTLKVLKQVEIFVTTGYIHGDIRPHNMMINPDTGVITIIDFDLFEPVSDFMKSNVAFYNRPPENYITGYFSDAYTIFNIGIRELPIDYKSYIKSIIRTYDNLKTKRIPAGIMDNDKYNLDHYIIYNNLHYHRKDDQLTKDKLIEILYNNIKTFVNKYIIGQSNAADTIPFHKIRNKWIKMIIPYFDAFGLATSLLELVTTVDYKDPAIISLRDNVLWKMVAWNIDERIDIFEAVKRVEAIIATAAEKPKEAAASVDNAVAAAVAAANAALAANKKVSLAPAKSPHTNAAVAEAAAGKVGGSRPRKTVRRGKKSKRHSTRFISRR